ncbi:MAG: GNAT family N-acetyltransferase, partial [Actinomycetota bacterium]
MELRDITMADLPLYVRILRDPRVMAELGGPLPEEGLEEKLRGIVADVEANDTWFSVIVPDGGAGSAGAGWVCIWETDQDGDTFSEIGWMVDPAHQGRGLASSAVREILDRATREGRWGEISAHPAVTNGPSNAICRKTGFKLTGERD